MLVRLAVGSAMAFALLATHAVALADPASARIFKGRTAQGYAIKLNVKDDRLKIVRFKADLKCRDGTALLLIESGFLWTRTRGNGSFRDAQFGRTDSVYFRGRVGERRVRGRLRLTDKTRRGPKCASRWIRFTAKPR